MTKTWWTIEKVKDELPDIKVTTPVGKVTIGHVRGRKMQFAGVWTDEGFHCEAAWSTIVHCLNNDCALRM